MVEAMPETVDEVAIKLLGIDIERIQVCKQFDGCSVGGLII